MQKNIDNPEKMPFFSAKCKLLLSKSTCTMHSTDLVYYVVFAGRLYRTVFCEHILFFDKAILTRLACLVGDPARAAVAYSLEQGTCRILSSHAVEPEAYAAAIFSLLCDGRIANGEPIEVISEDGAFLASADRDAVSLYK